LIRGKKEGSLWILSCFILHPGMAVDTLFRCKSNLRPAQAVAQGHVSLGGIFKLAGFSRTLIAADDQGDGFGADISSGNVYEWFPVSQQVGRIMTWFPDPEPSPTDLVSAGSRAWLTALDTLRYGRRGRGANLRAGSRPQDVTASPGTRHQFPFLPHPWFSLGNRTYKGVRYPATGFPVTGDQSPTSSSSRRFAALTTSLMLAGVRKTKYSYIFIVPWLSAVAAWTGWLLLVRDMRARWPVATVGSVVVFASAKTVKSEP